MMDCISCNKRKDGKDINGEYFCFNKKECTVPFAIIDSDGKILAWAD